MTDIYLCKKNELKEYQTRSFEVDANGETLSLFLLKQDGQVRAYLNSCPHLQIPLNWKPDEFMSIEGTHIQCSTHGALFQLEDGECISGPCRNQALTALEIDLKEDNSIYLVI